MIEEKECRRCSKEFSHGLGPADDPPLWMLYYCSELCRLKEWQTHTGILLMKIRAMVDDDWLSKEAVSDAIKSFEEELRCE